MIKSQSIKCSAKTQAMVAKSSVESELYGIVRASCETLGFIALAMDLGTEMKSRLHMDSTAAHGIIDRKGLSKVRYLDVHLLWLQEQMARDAAFVNVLGPYNNADFMAQNKQNSLGKLANFQQIANLAAQSSSAQINCRWTNVVIRVQGKLNFRCACSLSRQ